MSKMVKRIFDIAFHALLITVYAIFFSVQFFFNFDCSTAGNAQNFLKHFSGKPHSKSPAGVVTQASDHSSSRAMRLNKRFHQENIPPCEVLAVNSPKPYIIRRLVGPYRNHFLPSVTPAHRLMRGPPCLA
ncbi:MAG TPA: hypothetical protein VFE32_08640 [Puia sp.]|nr:hypothetical protein [Puia sp.]